MDKPVFPHLGTLEAVVAGASHEALDMLPRLALVCCQHLLETTGSLIECLVRNGLQPERVFVLGKVYSTNRSVVDGLKRLGCDVFGGSGASEPGGHRDAIRNDAKEMWSRAEHLIRRHRVEAVIVLDDGAHMTANVSGGIRDMYRRGKIVGVEQTTSGLGHRRAGFPIVNVASSAVKRHVEPSLICAAVIDRVTRVIGMRPQERRCGVIGLGKVGATLAWMLRRRGFSVVGHDIDQGRLDALLPTERCASAEELVQRSDVIFGCTGQDSVCPSKCFDGVTGTRIFASCSSGDNEFRSLLKKEWHWRSERHGQDLCPTMTARHPRADITVQVLRCGFPVNFDNSEESVPRDDIQLTRGLLLGAVLQAVGLAKDGMAAQSQTIKLDPVVQQIVLRAWREAARREDFDLAWYERESRGSQLPCRTFVAE